MNNKKHQNKEFHSLKQKLSEKLSFLGDQSAFETKKWWTVDDNYGFYEISIYLNSSHSSLFDRINRTIVNVLKLFPKWRIQIQFDKECNININSRFIKINVCETELSNFDGLDDIYD